MHRDAGTNEQIEKSLLNSRWSKPKIAASPLKPQKPLVLVLCKQVDHIAKQQIDNAQAERKPRYRQLRLDFVGNVSSLKQMIKMTRLHFETGERTQALLKVWRDTTLQKIIFDNPDKSRLECLELLFDYFRKIK